MLGEWKEKYTANHNSEQVKELGGLPADWGSDSFHHGSGLSKAVIDVFVDLHQKRENVPWHPDWVNWDPQGKTAAF